MAATRSLDLVIFGGTGDLAMRKLLPALYHLHCDALLSPAVRDEKLKILRALRPFGPGDFATRTVRDQYRAGASGGQPVPGYLEEAGIAADSRTETFVALKAEINTWRRAGVPFFLRTGKRMQEKVAEIVINFRSVPHSIFGVPASPLHANRMVIRMQP